MKIVDNIQITVESLHVRYEQPTPWGDGGYFAAGVTLDSFTIRSTDGKWTAVPDEQQQQQMGGSNSGSNSFVVWSKGQTHKLAWMRALAVYLDTDAEDLSGSAWAAAAASAASAASSDGPLRQKMEALAARGVCGDDGAGNDGRLAAAKLQRTRRLRRAGERSRRRRRRRTCWRRRTW